MDSSQNWPGKNKDKTKLYWCDLQPSAVFVVVWPRTIALVVFPLIVEASEEEGVPRVFV